MGKRSLALATLIVAVSLLSQSCSKKHSNVWDQDNTAANFNDKDGNLWGNELQNDKESAFGLGDDEFIALSDDDLKSQFADGAYPQSNKIPGEGGIPGISHFKDPTSILASIFRTVHFNTNEHVIRSQDYLNILTRVATYLKEHPSTYIFVTGHCDERGPEAFNLALGARRANYVRSHLVKHGASPDQIFTISYGKEQPVEFGHNHKAWAQNRRAEFKIYEK